MSEKLLEFIKWALPIRYWFHYYTSPRYGQEPMEWKEWKWLIMGIDYPGGGGVGEGYTVWRAFTNYNWRRVWRWLIFRRWLWGQLPIAWQHRNELRTAIVTWWDYGDVYK